MAGFACGVRLVEWLVWGGKRTLADHSGGMIWVAVNEVVNIPQP